MTERHYQRLDADPDAEHLQRRANAVIRAAELSGRHVWCVMTAFLIVDPDDTAAMLDRDSMMVYPAVGCFRCEEAYEPRLKLRRCPGEPS